MNERIEHCLYQSGLTAQGCWDELDDYAKQGIEKFAELIVAECAEQSMSIGRYNTPSGITPDLSIAIAVGLKKHFGVTE
jgi:hypothetical protein